MTLDEKTEEPTPVAVSEAEIKPGKKRSSSTDTMSDEKTKELTVVAMTPEIKTRLGGQKKSRLKGITSGEKTEESTVVVAPEPEIRPKKKRKAIPKRTRESRQLNREKDQRTRELMAQNEGMPFGAAWNVLYNGWELSTWQAVWEAHQQARKIQRKQANYRRDVRLSGREMEWVGQRFGSRVCLERVTEPEPAVFKLVRAGRFNFRVTTGVEEPFKLEKLSVCSMMTEEASSVWRSGRVQIPELVGARLVNPLEIEKRKKFDNSAAEALLGKRARVTLLNGIQWVGYLRWLSYFSLLLTSSEQGDESQGMLVFKHGCWLLEVVDYLK